MSKFDRGGWPGGAAHPFGPPRNFGVGLRVIFSKVVPGLRTAMASSFRDFAAVVCVRPADRGVRDGLLSRARLLIRQKICALLGHEQFLQLERHRMFLRCLSCGRETPGWDIGRNPPRVLLHGVRPERALRRAGTNDRKIA